METMKTVFRIMAVALIPFTAHFPAVCLISTCLLFMCQSSLSFNNPPLATLQAFELLKIGYFKFLLPPSPRPRSHLNAPPNIKWSLMCSTNVVELSKVMGKFLLLLYKKMCIQGFHCITLKRLDTSSSNAPPHPGRVQIPHLLGMGDGQMLMGCPGRCWISKTVLWSYFATLSEKTCMCRKSEDLKWIARQKQWEGTKGFYLFIYLFWTLSAVYGFLAYIMLGDGVRFRLCIVL